MLAGVLLSGLLCAGLTWSLHRRTGWPWSVTLGLFVWSLVVLGLITLLPANGSPGIVSAEGRLDYCSTDIGGPAPEGFWIVAGGQRLLNAVVFVPSGLLLVLVAARWRRAAWVAVPVGFALLVGYSVAIELTQLALARLDRACDVTDMIDNATGAGIGVVLGIPLAVVLRRRLGPEVRRPG
jgi:glycopeptide antibiotics resistance protein